MAAKSASVGAWEVVLNDLVTPVGLIIAAVVIRGDGAHVWTEPFSYEMESEADLEALIHESALEAFVKTKVPDNIQDIWVSLLPEKVHVRATVRMIIPVTANAVCTLRIEEGKRVFVDLESVEVLGAGVKGLVQKQLDAINPIVDVSELPFEVRLTEMRIEEGRLIAVGKARPPKAESQKTRTS
jgi:hypothetical protein